MKLQNAPQNEAILSNVGEIGEFRIRNSAKAFNILSSGLYANKIRAIIRELSCNAVDSHTAANRTDTPFDVHLPNSMEPYFSIRDYGTGLSHEQVTNIYTTYFESTKTDSNDYIGALGLGSKSPFSYTDNFTVTAIKDGVKGIYTAFINEAGVPSIAKMMDEATDEPTGVEVKFSVNDRYDFNKFADEARTVYTYFSLRPVVTGSSNFQFRDVEYDTKDIVPGVHSYISSRGSVAIMGNIAYPIDVPKADTSLGDLVKLLNCGLEMHFAIGELDFQASREGLSYIPSTVNAIKNKLVAVNTALSVVIAKEADAIPNLWDRAVFLYKKYNHNLWNTAVKKYVADTKLTTFDDSRYGGTRTFKMPVDELASKYNIAIRGFNYAKHSKAYANRKHDTEYSNNRNAQGSYDMTHYWGITVESRVDFVINDTKIGAVERAKFHYRQAGGDDSRTVFVLDPVDRSKAMKTDEFFNAIFNPPASQIMQVSSFLKKERADSGLGKNVTILALQERGGGGYYREKEMVWRDAGKADSFDDTSTYYYLPLSGFSVQSKYQMTDVKEFYNDLKDCGLKGLQTTIYGVRKTDIEFIKTKKNWINIEEHIVRELAKPIDNKLIMSLVLYAIDDHDNILYNDTVAYHIENTKSPYMQFISKLKGFDKIRYSERSLQRLCSRYASGVAFNPEAKVKSFVDECNAIVQRYPLLQYLRSVPSEELAKYINVIDAQKGI
jgi:hypothetical protein